MVVGCPGQVFKLRSMEKKPGWRDSPGTPPLAPPPMPPLPPLQPLASCARVPVLLRLHRQPPVHTEHTQLPPAWTQLARAFCKRWYCPDCVALSLPLPRFQHLCHPRFWSSFLPFLFSSDPSFLCPLSLPAHPFTVSPPPRHCAVFVNIGQGKSQRKK